MNHVLRPFASIRRAIWPEIVPYSFFLSLFVIPFELRPIRPYLCSFTILLPISPFTLINPSILFRQENPLPMAPVPEPASFVHISIGKCEFPLSAGPPVAPLALIRCSVPPTHPTLAVPEAPSKSALICSSARSVLVLSLHSHLIWVPNLSSADSLPKFIVPKMLLHIRSLPPFKSSPETLETEYCPGEAVCLEKDKMRGK